MTNVTSNDDPDRGRTAEAGRGGAASWACDVVLADGGTVHLRTAGPGDAASIEGFHERLSKETVYFRYFGALARLPPKLLTSFTTGELGRQGTLLAELGDEIIGMASYHRSREEGREDEAEVAFVVADDHQGRGLGTLLLEHLAAIASSQGIQRFTAETLTQNRAMLRVFRDSGFQVQRAPEGNVVRIAFPLAVEERIARRMEEREHRAEARSVARLMAPASIAVVGAGRKEGNLGREVLHNLQRFGYRGRLYPVNPNADRVLGLPAYPTVLAIPEEVALAVIVVPASSLTDVIPACAEKQVQGLVVITSGFGETDAAGARVEREIVAVARRYGMRMVGPNCMGIVNTAPEVSMNATFAPIAPRPGSVAFASQSGALGITVLAHAESLGVGLSSFVSLGNRGDVSTNDLLQYWEEDERTRVILLYLESLGNPRKLARIARRVSRSKPIVAVKSGRTVAGARAASSHTAAMATPDVNMDALALQAGILRVDTLEELFETAQVLATQPLPAGRRVAIVGNGGGPGILAADACDRAGLDVPELSKGLQAELAGLLPRGAAVRNPVDLLAAARPEQYQRVLERVLDSAEVDAVIASYTPTVNPATEEVTQAILAAAEHAEDKPVLACLPAWEPGDLKRGAAEGAGARRIPRFTFPESAARALMRAALYSEWRARPQGRVPDFEVDGAGARKLVWDFLRAEREGGWLPPETAGELLRRYGIPVVGGRVVRDAGEAAAVAESLGLPVVLKAASPNLVHKSDEGGVRLGLRSADEVRRAFTEMEERLGPRMGGALVQPMVEDAVETIVGIVHDQAFGPLLLFGLGGVATELLLDRSFRILPLTDVDAHELVRSLRGTPLLFGYRGAPAADVAALEDLLLRVGRLAADRPEIRELDLNPVLVRSDGVLAVDVKIRVAPDRPRPELATRQLG